MDKKKAPPAPLVPKPALGIFLMAEELFWIPGRFLADLLERIPVWGPIRPFLAGLSKEVTLALYLLPLIASIPGILNSLWLISHGYVIRGFLTLFLVRIFSIACSVRIYRECSIKLRTVPFFNKWFRTIMFNLNYAKSEVEKRPAYINMRKKMEARYAKMIAGRKGTQNSPTRVPPVKETRTPATRVYPAGTKRP